MSVLNRLASALGRRDEKPNQELAELIARSEDKSAITELVENLSNKKKDIQSDCIKTLYEVGERKPALIAPYVNEFGKLLQNKNNRLVWGAMCALDAAASANPKAVYKILPLIITAADKGTVITKDHTVGVLSKLAHKKEYVEDCIPLLLEQLMKAPDNQFPAYAEKTLQVINPKNRNQFQHILELRLKELQHPAKIKRVEKVLKKV